ncbi:MAG TPA: efflux RND transporter periplasmic adaptor subunit [Rhizomicrobium sp.]|nr:efflux RND transporter periplasmic adaptor subunit [Rhizomicrobium sp.]
MPDTNPDGQPDTMGIGHTREKILRHIAPPSLKRWGKLALAAAMMIAVAGIGLRLWQDHTTAVWTEDQAIPTVQLVKLPKVKAGDGLNLPGEVQAFATAPIYAQVSGYVKKWYVDIGGTVKKGQLLAELDVPDIAGQTASARASLINAQAALKLSAATQTRWEALFQQGAVSRQDKDEKDADLAAKNAAVAAARANLFSFSSQENFRRLVAPFDGVVTSRAVDVGNLVTVGNAATPLFTVADQSRLRIYVQVPQNYAPYIHPGMRVTFTVPQYPSRVFTAALVASAGAVAQATGTILVQFGIDNEAGALSPGNYAQVRFPLPASANGVRVPATALMFRDAGMQVATVDAKGRVRLKTGTISRDLGAAVDVGAGLSPRDRIIDNPQDSLQEGDPVRVAAK